jgi:predicted adenylyl cyclase CyaB
MPRNIEVKARIDSVQALLPRALQVAPGTAERIDQDDTFFNVPHGRLKLRQLADGSAELIHYHRADSAAAKASDYVRVPVADAAALREALARGCGVLGRVRKTRLLVVHRQGGFHTRIHLDQVHGLGDFMELEVVLADGQGDAQGAAHADGLMRQLGLQHAPREAGAYLDLLRQCAQGEASAAGTVAARKS